MFQALLLQFDIISHDYSLSDQSLLFLLLYVILIINCVLIFNHE